MKIKIKSANAAVPDQEITVASGEKVAISPGDTISFPEEVPVAAVPLGNDLVVFFADGSSVVLEGFFVFGPDEEPARIDLGEGRSFSADYGFQADDGPIVFLFGSDGIDSTVGYEPFPLSELGTIGGLSGLVTLGIAELLGFGELGDQLSDVGEVIEIPIPLPTCMDGGTFSGSGFVSGTDCDDILIATSDSGNFLSALGGNDILQIVRALDVQNNVLVAGDGNDSLFLASLTEDIDANSLAGGSGDDTIVLRALAPDGDVRSNTIVGGAGDDVVNAAADDDFGSNLVNAGAGDDRIRINADDIVENRVNAGDGDDLVAAVADEDASLNFFDGGEGNDIIYADAFLSVERNTLMGGDGTGRDRLFLLAGGDILDNTLDGGMGSDTIILGRDFFLDATDPRFGTSDDISRNSLFGGLGVFNDTLQVIASDDAWMNTLVGGGGNDNLRAEALDDSSLNSLSGGDGDDRLLAQAGGGAPNTLSSGDAAKNILDGGSGDDFIGAASNDGDVYSNRLMGGTGGGIDQLMVSAADDSYRNTLDGGGGADVIEVVADGDATMNSLFGGVHPGDTLGLGPGDNDRLAVRAGDDAFANILDGGEGDDVLIVEATDDVTLNRLLGGAGADVLLATTLHDDTLRLILSVVSHNVLRGGDGDDQLALQAVGSSTEILMNELFGESGNDVLLFDAGPDQTVQNVLGMNVFDGGNHVFAGPAATLGGDTLRILDGGDVASSGRVTNIEVLDITNSAENEVNLNPGEVADITSGGDSTLRVIGDGGASPLDHVCVNLRDWHEIAGEGAPGFTLFQDNAGDGIFVEVQTDLITFVGAGINTLSAGGAILLAGTAGNDTLGVDALSPAGNTLDGLGGNDSLFIKATNIANFNWLIGDDGSGCSGDDILAMFGVGDFIDNTLEGGDGSDSLFISSSAGDVGDNSLSGDSGYGHDTLVVRAVADGKSVYGNTLRGGAGQDSLWAMTSGVSDGGAGLADVIGNTLDGGDGRDILVLRTTGSESEVYANSLFGGEGNDSLFVMSSDDIDENTVNGGAGADVFRGIGADDASGNSLFGGVGEYGDTLILSVREFAYNNILQGGAGADLLVLETALEDVTMNRLFGGMGPDDTLGFGAGDRDTLVIRAGDDAYANLLQGGEGADSLLIEAGEDVSLNTLFGGAGDFRDTLALKGLDDVYQNTLDGGDGADSLFVAAVGDATLNRLFGGAGDDVLVVSAEDFNFANKLDGGDGNDSLLVKGFNDDVFNNTLVGGDGNDTLVAISEDDVTLNRLLGGDGADSLRVESTVFSVYDNFLEGGTGDDVLALASDYLMTGNILLGGDGDDVLTFRINTVYQSIQETIDGNTFDGGANSLGGGAGAGDTLRILAEGEMRDSGGITNIEVLDFTNGEANLIDLDTLTVASIIGAEDSLTIHGDGPGDTVVIDPTQWTGPTLDGNFNVFANADPSSGLRLLVQNDLTIVAPVAPSPLAGDAVDAGQGAEGLYSGETVPGIEIDFDALAWRDGSLPGGEADGFGPIETGARGILVGVEDVLDFAGSQYAGALAAVESGGWDGTGNFAGAGGAGVFALDVPEMAILPGAGVSSLLDFDAIPDDVLGVG